MPKRKRTQKAAAANQEPKNDLLPQVCCTSPALNFVCSNSSQKRHYRQRAHANPFSDHALDYPSSPETMEWDVHYPAFSGSGKTPEFADIGCGFGGLLVALAPLYPDILMLG